MNEREIFVTAAQLPPEQRSAALATACGADLAMRARVELLLRDQERLGNFLEAPALTTSNDPTVACATERIGDWIGTYHLLQVIGEGGMGIVYLAEQAIPVNRRVALKIIKPGMDTRHVIARFEAERQALAMMDHPCIAKVFDAGSTASGRPYFVMELVQGMRLTEYCDRHQLSLSERLELFVRICQAVQHAHQKGIIHRDLKPSNVLVTTYDDQPIPKVIDFGLAKAMARRLTDKTVFTELGQIMGTLEYMSPEQAEFGQLDVDTRSDIYSLGVILYELLTGTTPFESVRLRRAAIDEILRIIREEEPPKPSTRLSSSQGLPAIAAQRHSTPQTLSSVVRGDLDWIVMKTLEKSRQRRYDTVTGLVDDIERYLKNEPVTAVPPDAIYRVRKFMQRNRRALIPAGLVLLALVLGGAGTISGLMQASWERGKKVHAETAAALSDKLAKNSQEAHERTQSLLQRVQAAEREVQIRAHLAQARAVRLSGQPGQRVQCLAEVAAAMNREPNESLRSELAAEATMALTLADLQPSRKRENWPYARRVRFDRDFERYLESAPDGSLKVCGKDDTVLMRVEPLSPKLDRATFSQNGKWLIAQQEGTKRGTLTRFWDLASGDELEPLVGSLIGITNDDQLAATWISLDEGEVAFYRLETREEVGRFKVGGGWRGMALSPDGTYLAVSGPEFIEFWSKAGASVHQARISGPCLIAWHPSERFLAAGGTDRRVHVWDVAFQRRQAISESIRAPFSSLTFDPTGNLLATTGWDDALRLWDPLTGRQHLAVDGITTSEIKFSHDGRWLGTTQDGDTLTTWEVTTSDECRTIAGPYASEVLNGIELSAEGRFLFHTTPSVIEWWDVTTRRQWNSIPVNGSRLSLDPRDGSLLTLGARGQNRWPLKWEVGTGANEATVSIGPPQSLGKQLPFVGATVFSANGHWALIDDRAHQEILALSLDDAKNQRRLPAARAMSMAISNDGQWIATGAQRDAKTPTTIWQISTGKAVKELPAADVRGEDIALWFTPNDQRLVTSTAEGVRIWDVMSWRELLWLPRTQGGPWPAPVAIAPDGGLLAFAPSINVVQLLDLQTLREVARLSTPHIQNVNALRFSLDSGSLAVGRDNTVINVWDLRALRRQLDQLGLDWKLPAIAPSAATAFYQLTKVQTHRGRIVPLAVYVSPNRRIDELTQKLHESPGDVAALIERGRLLAGINQLDRAEVDCETALRLQPGNVEALAWLTIVATRGQRPQQADAWFAPLLATPVGSRSNVLAETCYTVAFQILTSQELDPRSIALACQAAQRAVDLISATQSVDDLTGTLARYLFKLAAARARAGQRDLALAAYDRAVRWCDEHADAPVTPQLDPDRRAAAELLGVEVKP